MFFTKSLQKDLILDPRDLGPNLREIVRERLTEQLEGTLEANLGYIIVILSLKDEDIVPGRIEYETGGVEVMVKVTVLLFRPFKNEILDAVVSVVNNHGFFADAGPIKNIHVNKHQMPSDFHFEELEGVWRTEDEEVEIRPGCGVRMKVIGVDITPNMMSVVGSIKDDYTGFIQVDEDM